MNKQNRALQESQPFRCNNSIKPSIQINRIEQIILDKFLIISQVNKYTEHKMMHKPSTFNFEEFRRYFTIVSTKLKTILSLKIAQTSTHECQSAKSCDINKLKLIERALIKEKQEKCLKAFENKLKKLGRRESRDIPSSQKISITLEANAVLSILKKRLTSYYECSSCITQITNFIEAINSKNVLFQKQVQKNAKLNNKSILAQGTATYLSKMETLTRPSTTHPSTFSFSIYQKRRVGQASHKSKIKFNSEINENENFRCQTAHLNVRKTFAHENENTSELLYRASERDSDIIWNKRGHKYFDQGINHNSRKNVSSNFGASEKDKLDKSEVKFNIENKQENYFIRPTHRGLTIRILADQQDNLRKYKSTTTLSLWNPNSIKNIDKSHKKIIAHHKGEANSFLKKRNYRRQRRSLRKLIRKNIVRFRPNEIVEEKNKSTHRSKKATSESKVNVSVEKSERNEKQDNHLVLQIQKPGKPDEIFNYSQSSQSEEVESSKRTISMSKSIHGSSIRRTHTDFGSSSACQEIEKKNMHSKPTKSHFYQLQEKQASIYQQILEFSRNLKKGKMEHNDFKSTFFSYEEYLHELENVKYQQYLLSKLTEFRPLPSTMLIYASSTYSKADIIRHFERSYAFESDKDWINHHWSNEEMYLMQK